MLGYAKTLFSKPQARNSTKRLEASTQITPPEALALTKPETWDVSHLQFLKGILVPMITRQNLQKLTRT